MLIPVLRICVWLSITNIHFACIRSAGNSTHLKNITQIRNTGIFCIKNQPQISVIWHRNFNCGDDTAISKNKVSPSLCVIEYQRYQIIFPVLAKRWFTLKSTINVSEERIVFIFRVEE
jgi:hypothetical protein